MKIMSHRHIPIHFHYLAPPFYFPNRIAIKKFLLSLFNDYTKQVENINYIFCTDKYLLELNKEYLNHDYYTDIITFELGSSKAPLVSDIYISVDRARENAQTHSVPMFHEVMRLLIHGALHLCGKKDKRPKDYKTMKQLEELYLNKWFHVKQG